MKLILVATKQTQGRRKNDFGLCEEGEPVHFAMECDRETVDGKCGCKRSMSGLITHKGTTTFMVAESNADIESSIKKFYTDVWKVSEGEAENRAAEEAGEIFRTAAFFGVGTILEKRGKNIKERKVAAERKAS